MCGIVAFFSRCLPISEAALQRATQSLYHRGPDGQRHWMSEGGRVALGHSRLSIIDLITGDQPIASEDGRTRIIVNGEFYGYEAIQRELEGSGHLLRTRSDSEIALHLLQELDPFLLLLDLTDGTFLRLEGGRSVLKELLLPAIEDCGSQSILLTQVRNWDLV